MSKKYIFNAQINFYMEFYLIYLREKRQLNKKSEI